MKNIFIMKTLTDFRKTVETGVDPRLNHLLFPQQFAREMSECYSINIMVSTQFFATFI